MRTKEEIFKLISYNPLEVIKNHNGSNYKKVDLKEEFKNNLKNHKGVYTKLVENNLKEKLNTNTEV